MTKSKFRLTKENIEIEKSFHEHYTTRSRVSNTRVTVLYTARKGGKFACERTMKEAVKSLKRKLK